MARPETHGAYSLRAKGFEAMTREELLKALETDLALATADGRKDAIRRQAVMQNAMLARMTTHVAEQVKDGKSLEQIHVFNKLPRFWNSHLRTLKQLHSMSDDEIDWKARELEAIDAKLGAGDE